MASEKNINNENKSAEKYWNTFCFNGQGMPEMMAKCCDYMSRPGDCRSMMTECMRRCRWFLLIPLVIGILLLLLCYVLDAEVTRIIWIAVAGFMIFMGILGFLMIILSKRGRVADRN
jgi:hypothetical protein